VKIWVVDVDDLPISIEQAVTSSWLDVNRCRIAASESTPVRYRSALTLGACLLKLAA